MFSRLATLTGILSAFLGLLIVVKRINRAIWTLQLVLNEFSLGVVLLGMVSTWRSHSGLGKVAGLTGALLAAVPFSRVKEARSDMEQAMRAGLGKNYDAQIPSVMRDRLTPHKWSLKNTLGASYRENNVSIIHDVPYHETSARTLKADIYRPLVPPVQGDRYPVIIAFHGGGWNHGDKGEYFSGHHCYLATQGYVVVDVQYRFTIGPDNVKWPAQLDDVRAAIRWVKSQADVYNIDRERVALLGRSAGGHIALNAAYRANGDFADTAVQAVVAYYAPIDLFLVGKRHDHRVLGLLGGETSYENPEIYADASPLEFADENVPPTLLLHGYSDALVSPVHAELLLNRLRRYDVPVAVLRVPWGRHGFDFSLAGLGAQLTQYHLDRFLAWALTREAIVKETTQD